MSNHPPTTEAEGLRDYLRGRSFQIGLEDFTVRPKMNYFYLTYEAIDQIMQLHQLETAKAVREARIDELDSIAFGCEDTDENEAVTQLIYEQAHSIIDGRSLKNRIAELQKESE